jgi:hypothetical protein
VAHAFAAGSRIRVAISTTYWPIAWPSPEPATLTVFTGASRLELPVRAPRPEDAALRDFPAAEGAEPLARTFHRPASHRRWVERDIGAGLQVLHVHDDHGHFTIDHTGQETDYVHRESYRIRDDDPLSAEIEIETTISIGRGDWRTRSETRTLMRADRTDFHLEARLESFENEAKVISRSWRERIPRDLN